MFRNISVLLTANSTSLRSELVKSARAVDGFGTSVSRAATSVANSTKAMQAAGVAAGITVVLSLKKAIGAAAEFDARMRNVASISEFTKGQFNSLSKSVLDLSKRVPKSANDLAEGLYEISSSGFQGAEALKVLEASAVAASAGLTTTETAATAIAAVLNAYGRGAGDATAVSDALFASVKVGVGSFEDFANAVGDSVGMAAAAGVGINDLGAALAAMTRAGLGTAEAGTSAQRLMQELIDPSEALVAVYRQLGYESGASALKQKGMYGVIEDLRGVTGGTLEALIPLFPEIRAARGALNLMAADGRLYAEAQRDVGNVTNAAGGSLAAFRKQMEGVSAQWTVFRNQVTAGAITLGTKLLPVVLDVMKGMQRLGRSGVQVLQSAIARLTPFFRSIASIGSDLTTIFMRMAGAAAPVVRVMTAIAASGVITTLNTLSSTLAALVGFVTDNEVAFAALAGVLTAAVVPSMIRLAVSMTQTIYLKALYAIDALRFAYTGMALTATSATTAVRMQGGVLAATRAALLSTVSATTAATLGFGLLAAGAVLAFRKINSGRAEARDNLRAALGAVDVRDSSTIAGALKAASEEQERIDELLQDRSLSRRRGLDAVKGLLYKASGQEATDHLEARARIKELSKAQDELNDMQERQRKVGMEIARDTGLGYTDVIKIAKQAEADLTKTGRAGEEVKSKVVAAIGALERETGLSSAKIAENHDQAVKFKEALADIRKQVQGSFSSATDILGTFELEDAATQTERVTAARERLRDAEDNLAQTREREIAAKKRSHQGDRDIRDATEAVTKAKRELNEAVAKQISPGDQLKNQLQENLRVGRQFLSDIRQAIARGVDPEGVKKFLLAGPKAAGPILQALLSDHSGGLIRMFNETEQVMRQLGERAVEYSRLTQLAIQAGSDEMRRALPLARRLFEEATRQGEDNATAESISKALGIPLDEAYRVGKLFGMRWADGRDDGLAARPMKPTYGTLPGGKRIELAAGGLVRGPGTGTSDSIPAWLSKGEYVLRAAAVNAIGVGRLDHLNRVAYASGGYVGRMRATTGTAPSTTTNHYSSIRNYEFSGPIVGVRLEDAIEFAERQDRLAALTGGQS